MAKAVQLITISDSKYIQKIDSLNSVENVSQIYIKKIKKSSSHQKTIMRQKLKNKFKMELDSLKT